MIYLLEAILLAILFFLAAFTAASEIGIIAASRFKLKRLVSEGSGSAKVVLMILEMPEKFLGTILVANNVIETLIAAIVTAIVISFIGERTTSVIFATAIAAFLIIIFEVAAKTIAARYAERTSVVLARPVQFLIFILAPVVKILAVITNFIVEILVGKPQKKAALVTEEEIRSMLKISHEEGVIHKDKYKLLSRAFDFSEATVKDVMTPKKDMVSVEVSSKFDDILALVLESGYSRVPVYKDDPDNIIGVMNMKDLLSLTCNRELVVMQDIVYPVMSVPRTKKVADLLREFQKGHAHLAIVVDEDNKVDGIVTLEDLLEEIVGEIEDEYDIRISNKKAPSA
jgi:putative hemolysin